MNALGIYFGPKSINIAETKNKKLINSIPISQEKIVGTETDEKVPDEIKLVALFNNELRMNKVMAKEAGIVLSGKDLIIRTFEVPVIPKDELANAINFEARKYIPFKIEELVLDYQLSFDKVSRKNTVLLVGIKKEILNKYISIFKQLNIEISSLEYAGFSILRLLSLAGVKCSGVTGIIDANITEADEINFTVLENDFPLFNRDIVLTSGPEVSPKPEELDSGMLLEKLKTEIRISLDYYHRKFPTKKINKVFFICGKDGRQDIEAFAKEIGLTIQFVDLEKHIGKPVSFSLSFLKSYSSSLAKAVKTPIRIDLLMAKTKMTKVSVSPLKTLVPLLQGLRLKPAVVVLALLMCIGAFALGVSQRFPIEKDIAGIKASRPKVATVNPDSNYEELLSIDSKYRKKIKNLHDLIKKQLYLTEPLSTIPSVIPKDIWLSNFSFNTNKDGRIELTLEGLAYLGDSAREFELVNNFASSLKGNSNFNKYFKEVEVASLETEQVENEPMTRFLIFCRN